MGVPDNKYNLAAELGVMFPIGHDFDTEMLERLIHEIDRINPWVSHYVNGDQAPSINWTSRITMREGNGIDRHYFVEIRPPFLHTFDRARAYERYANNLASNLAQVLPKEAIGVTARLIVSGCVSETHRIKK